MSNQTAIGNIVVDKISTLIMNLFKKSSYTWTINGDNIAKNIELVLDKTCNRFNKMLRYTGSKGW